MVAHVLLHVIDATTFEHEDIICVPAITHHVPQPAPQASGLSPSFPTLNMLFASPSPKPSAITGPRPHARSGSPTRLPTTAAPFTQIRMDTDTTSNTTATRSYATTTSSSKRP